MGTTVLPWTTSPLSPQTVAALSATLDRWVTLVRAEYREMPGLRLTGQQAQRLWGLDSDTCDTILSTLVATGFLARTLRGVYVRADLV